MRIILKRSRGGVAMKIYHNSHLKEFRSPFGAVPTGSRIRLAVKAECEQVPEAVILRLWDGAERQIEMESITAEEDGILYSAEVDMPEEPGLLWYYFIIRSEGRTFYYSNNSAGLGGEGEMTERPTEISYQITVFDKKFKTPDWFKNSVMYQIFPDRFQGHEKTESIPKKRPEYIIHGDWYEPLSDNRHPYENGPACNDFYGGSFRGIMSRLPYLKELGISVIYLNPIFEAYSNHRYDTGDYSKTDPILGTEEDFRELCRACGENGIKIILDGVFSHTGSDSVYFNKYGNYGENTGAYRDNGSPYREWYKWDGSRDGYESWWGCSNLPNIIETNPTYIDYILSGSDAIIKKWLRCGASGWRLDVADELPDEFIKILREQVKLTDPDAVVIGEVWEDASNKVSYGCRREYLLGSELDGAMNYPFKDNIISFVLGHIDAAEFGRHIMSIIENYPAEAMYAAMNVLGTHDTVRIKTVMGEMYPPENADSACKQSFRLTAAAETRAIRRVRLAAFLQMTFVGVPCIYYGDEIGMQGLADPYNRMPFTWRCVDPELLEYYRALTGMRNSVQCMRTGGFRPVYTEGGVFAYLRKIENGRDAFGNKCKNQSVLCIINRNEETAEICIDGLKDGVMREYFDGTELSVRGGKVTVELAGCGMKAFCTI